MIVLCGVDEFPAGPWTQTLAARFADSIGAELRIVDGGPAAHHVAVAQDTSDGVLLFGHAPARGVAAALRASPCPVAIAPPGMSAREWDEVIVGSRGDSSEHAGATAGVLAARLGAVLRVVVSEVRKARPAEQLLSAARERDTSLLVVAADRPPRWFDVLRPSFTGELLHDSRELVVVVPPSETRIDAPQAGPGRETAALP